MINRTYIPLVDSVAENLASKVQLHTVKTNFQLIATDDFARRLEKADVFYDIFHEHLSSWASKNEEIDKATLNSIKAVETQEQLWGVLVTVFGPEMVIYKGQFGSLCYFFEGWYKSEKLLHQTLWKKYGPVKDFGPALREMFWERTEVFSHFVFDTSWEHKKGRLT